MPRQFLSIWVRSWRVLRHDYDQFSSDPQVQYRYHRRMILFWMANFLPMNCIATIDFWATLAGHDKVALLMTSVLLVINTNYSLYANWDTEVGDAHGAYAGLKANQIAERQHNDMVRTSAEQTPAEADF